MKSPQGNGRWQGPIRPAASMPMINPHAAGIDVGATEHYVCVPSDAVAAPEDSVRSFRTFTPDLDQLVEWLQRCGIQSAAMESTGVYWIALYERLEAAGIKPVLVNSRHLKQVPGRKTDVKDCQWIQQLHSYGLLNGSFRPDQEICRLRTLLRHRSNLIEQKAQQVQHMQRVLQEMNILLHHVVSDLDGQTGFRILDAILGGERNPDVLVQLRDPHIKRSTIAQMKAALHGQWKEESMLVLGQAREAYRFFEMQILQCDHAIEGLLQALPAAAAGVAPDNLEPAPAPTSASAADSLKKNANAGPEATNRPRI